MGDAETVFGVNFADGRIKGYETGPMPGQNIDKQFYVYYVRGNAQYGINNFVENSDNTISDNATGLMWSQNDSGEGLNWEEALAWVQQMNTESYLGHNDWRLPNPFNPTTIITFSNNSSTSSAELTLYNLKGQQIKKFDNLANEGHVTWDGKDENDQEVASGTYFYVYSDGDNSVTNKMTLMK